MEKKNLSQKTKRLQPKSHVLRELYLKSGNQCAFPGCYNPIVDAQGNFVGEVCHIEAAMPGGERYNPNMSDEDRRSYDNLMLMCHTHHVVTDDVDEYTVDVLKKIKREHEEKFSGIVERMKYSVVDYGITNSTCQCINCKRMSRVLWDNCTDEENKENAKILNELLEKMTDLPIMTRKFLGIMAMRSFEDNMQYCVVPIHEIEITTGMDAQSIICHVDILKRKGISSDIEMDDALPFCTLKGDFKTGWSYWNDIREFCNNSGISIERICVDLDFSAFDE